MKAHHKKVGPGGIKCPCCNPYGSLSDAKRRINRGDRRKLRQVLAGR